MGAQAAPAGSNIVNQAFVDYFDGLNPISAGSNTVNTRVLPIYSIRLTPPGTVASPAFTLAGVAGDTLYCRFLVDNLGNARDSLAVAYRGVPPSTGSVAGTVFFFDADANGAFDPGEDDPSFLVFDAGGLIALDAGFILPAGAPAGDVYVEITAASVADPSARDISVVHISVSDVPASSLHLGPAGNPRALPGGEGSRDDTASGRLGYSDFTYTFVNELFNDSPVPHLVELVLPDLVSIAAGVRLTVADSSGSPIAPAPSDVRRVSLGSLRAGESRRFQVEVTSTNGEPLFKAAAGTLSIGLTARSLTDTLLQNSTVDLLLSPSAVDARAAIALKQTFYPPVASAGDVVSLVVTVENITDSLRVDDLDVNESVQPALSFLSSPDFEWGGHSLRWRAGSLGGGESRTAVIKFVANTRVTEGKATATGRVGGRAESGDDVFAGPVVSLIKLENDVFGDEGVILGDVFVDHNGNGARDEGEPGVANVAVYLESGEYAVTDSSGMFSIPRVFSGYRMVRLEESGLPGGVRLGAIMQGEPRPGQRLIHLLPSGHARVSFPLEESPEPEAVPVEVERSLTCQEKVSIRTLVPSVPRAPAISLTSSHFALGKSTMGYGAERSLTPLVAFMSSNPGWKLLVEGHTDSIPINSQQYPSNYVLSLARADAVRDQLAVLGIDHTRVIVRGYADTRPIASNATVEGRRHNRRVELSYIPPDASTGEGIDAGVAGDIIRTLSAGDDSCRVSVLWAFHSDTDKPMDGILNVSVPALFDSVDVVVTNGGRRVTSSGTSYPISGMSRRSAVECRVSFRAALADTATIRGLLVTLDVGGHRAAVRPYQAGISVEATTRRELARWSELVADDDDATTVADSHTESTGLVELLEPADTRVYTNRDRIRVRARLPLGTRSRILVNGEPVADTRVGQRTVDVAGGIEQIDWYAVQIRAGWNTVVLESKLIDGTVVVDSVRVALSSRPASATAVRARVLVTADGHSGEILAFDISDGLGLPVADGTVVDVVAGDGLVDAVDARPGTRGLQVLTRDGRVLLPTKHRNDAGRGIVAIECDGLRAETDVIFVSGQRPFFATGIVDLKLGSFETGGSGSGTGIEDYHDGVRFDADSRLFAQGAMPHGIGVTVRLDSRKRYDDPLLKDINPERQYPVFGDASSLHHAAPAQGGNYVSVDRGESFLRYGDFRTPLDEGEFLSYRRAATGVSSSLVNGRSSFHSFVTRTDFSAHQDELPADGTSGFYYLSRGPVVEHSEQMFLETRDRYRPEKVLDVRPLVRNRDYTINYFDGSLLFKEPVDAFDRDFNPVTIVASYEVETHDDAQYLYGARGNLAEYSNLRLGATAVARSGEGQNYSLYGADVELRLGELRFSGEVARSDDDATGSGNAFKVEASYEDKRNTHSVYLRRVDGGFTNPSFRGGSHELSSLKTGFQSRLAVSGDLALEAEGFVHRLDRTGEQKENLRAVAVYHHPYLRFVGGMRVARHEEPTDDRASVLSIFGVELGNGNTAGVSTVWEKSMTGESVEDYPDRLKTQASLPVGERYKLLASHEYLTASGRAGSHQATAGVESRLGENTTAYSKYSMNRTATDERMGAVTGLKQKVRVREGLSGTLSLETFSSLSDRPDDEYVSVKSGLDARTPGHHLVQGQYEYRWQTRRTKHLFKLNVAREMRDGFTALLKNVLAVAPDKDARSELSFHNSLALAHRPAAGKVHSLWMLRNDYERYTPANPEAVTWRMVFSGDVNVMVAPDHELRFRYAYKHVEDYSYGVSHTVDADLVLGQYIYRFARAWDLDVWGRTVRQHGGGSVEGGTGIEVGRLFLGALRVAVGYSVNGFEDPDFVGTDAWSRGVGVRVQLLLSEWLLNDLGVVE